MRILAIDSSGLVASVALLEDDVLLGEYSTNFHKTHSATLLPMIDELFGMLSLDIAHLCIDAVAIAKGPGSFTGLRIGAAAAKGLSLSLDVPIIPVSSLAGMAYSFVGSAYKAVPLMDARRNETYCAVYSFCGLEMNEEIAPKACGISKIISELNALGGSAVFSGDGVPVFAETINNECALPFIFAPAHTNRQRAASLGALAMYMAKKDESAMIDGDDFVPEYMSAAIADANPETVTRLTVPGASHAMSYFVDTKTYLETVDKFIKRTM